MTPGRRRLLALAAALLIAGLAGGVVLLADDGDDPSGPGSRPAVAPEGSLRVGVPGLPATYNPFELGARGPAANQILRMVLPQLFEVAPDGSTRGSLVDDETVDVEGRTATFELADGARWSDGTPITVADLQFTLDVVRSDAWPGPDAGYDRIQAIEGEGGRVAITFSERLPGWRRLFSGDDYVLPAHRLGGGEPAGAWSAGPDLSGGPYLFEGSTPGFDVVLRANPEWWGAGPGIADLQVLTVPDATTLFQLFERGELDVVWMPAYTDRMRQLDALDGIDVTTAPPGGRLFSVYAQAAEVAEPLRLASLDLIDRDRFVEVLMAEEAELAASWGRLDRDPGWPNWVIDSSRADGQRSTDLQVLTPEEEPMAGLFVRALQHRARRTPLAFDSVELSNDLLDGEWLPEGRFSLALVDEIQWPQPCWRCRWDPAYVGETAWSRADADDVEDLAALAARADRGDQRAASALERRLERAGIVLPVWRPAAAIASRGVAGIEANAWSPGPFAAVQGWVVEGD